MAKQYVVYDLLATEPCVSVFPSLVMSSIYVTVRENCQGRWHRYYDPDKHFMYWECMCSHLIVEEIWGYEV